MLLLKRCIMPSLSKDAIAIEVVYPRVLLTHEKPLGLPHTMVCKLQNVLCKLVTDFCWVKKPKAKGGDLGDVVQVKSSNPRLEMLYAYFMAWFMMHCPKLMTFPSIEGSDRPPRVEQHEKCNWKNYYVQAICKTVHILHNYHIYCYFLDFTSGNYMRNSGTPAISARINLLLLP